MKYIGRLLTLISFVWLLTAGLHSTTHLLQPIFGVPPSLRWFWRLPLPVSVWDPWSVWPLLLGIAGALVGALLVDRAKRTEKERKEESEA
ncbi:MAG: hypothetical protein HYV95_03705 [Opitutae bacterium]|nr:hypothetical protein [Opitutae bacterium]